MLIYTNYLQLSTGAQTKALGAVLKWLENKYPKAGLRASDVATSSRGVKQFGPKEYLEVVADGGTPESPDLWLLRLVHPDREVNGREWRTEIGLAPSSERVGSRALSVALSVEDKSPLVRGRIVPSRPAVVKLLADSGALAADTCGLRVKTIDSEDAARAFGFECDDSDRKHLVLLVSPDPASKAFVVDPHEIQDLVLGLSDVVQIAPELDPFLLTKTLGKRYSSWNGAIAFLYPQRAQAQGRAAWQNVPILPDRLREAISNGDDAARTVILPRVVHWANHRLSSRIVTSEMLAEARIRRRLDEARQQIQSNQLDADAALKLVEEAGKLETELAEKRKALADVQAENQLLESELDGKRRELEHFKNEFASALANAKKAVPRPASVDPNIVKIARGFLEGRPKVRVALELVASAAGDRVAVLDSALKSADEVEKIDKATVLGAFDMLLLLCNEYYESVVSGKGDVAGAKLFGANGFASRDKELGPKGKRLRTFKYEGREIYMETHLKIGVKDSPNSCWRCHFSWDADNRRLIIGHCGKHLDFA